MIMPDRRLTVKDFQRMKTSGKPFAALTAYDALFARLIDRAGIEMILIGDSLGNVVQGKSTTLPVTLDEMIYHGEIVSRTVSHAFVAVDMPFMSYQVNADESVRNAGKIMQRTGCGAVKVEGGIATAKLIRRLVSIGIPVIGHVGLTPQSVHVFGGYGLQGRENPDRILDDARAVEQAGAFAVVLEKIPAPLAQKITGTLSIPTIGIGAGPDCDGQILVLTDMLGLDPDFNPRFARKYADFASLAVDAFRRYADDVRNHAFPSADESFE